MSHSEDTLRKLHSALTNTLLEKIAAGEASAGELAVAAKLLKDNGINCNPAVQPNMARLAGLLDSAFEGPQDDSIQ